MPLTMTSSERWIEHDYNPLILFDQNGRILSLNQEAQYLLGDISSKELFEIALNYASSSYGFKTHFLELELGRFEFFAITIGYENDQEIGIRLYKRPRIKFNQPLKEDTKLELSSLYVLVDLAISTHTIKSGAKFHKEFDPTLPEFYLPTEELMNLLNKTYRFFLPSTDITTKISINIGEHVRIKQKKYQIVRLEISGEKTDPDKRHELNTLHEESNTNFRYKDNLACIDIPMITP